MIKHSPFTGKMIQKVALCGGAGSFLISEAKAAGADVYVSSDMKYHEFFDADGQILLADIGHYESEQFTIDLLYDLLKDKFLNFALLKTGVNTNPVHCFVPEKTKYKEKLWQQLKNFQLKKNCLPLFVCKK